MTTFENTQIAFAHQSNTQLYKTYGLFRVMNSRQLVAVGKVATSLAFKLRMPISWLLKHSIYEQFCGGEDLPETQKVVDHLASHRVQSLLDYGVEAKSGEPDFERTTYEVKASIEYAHAHDEIPAVSTKVTGLARYGLLEKLSHDAASLNRGERDELQRVKRRLNDLCHTASVSNTSIYFDAEESWIQTALDDLITEMMRTYNKGVPVVYNTLQLYRHDRLAYLKKMEEEARKQGWLLAVKPVRGAYMEKERERAQRLGYPSPIQPDKATADHDFNAALRFCIQNFDNIAVCNASHNEESAHLLMQLMEEAGLPKNHGRICFAQLYGMSDNISFNLAHEGYNVLKYLPYGPVKEVIPYLIRRAEENTAVTGQMSRELQLIRKEMKRRNLKYV